MKISSDLFDAFLKCPSKCWLRAAAEPASGNAYAEWVRSQNGSYHASEIERLLSETPKGEIAVSPPPENLKAAKWRLATNLAVHAQMNSCVLESQVHAVDRAPSEGRARPPKLIPIRFTFRNKLDGNDKLLLAFDTFVLSEVTGREISFGKIIHGDDHSALKVKTAALCGKVRTCIDRIAALLSSPTPPDLVLNRHCSECEFQTRCRQKAIEADDLSLLSGMTEKERKKLRDKGIFTVTQLSYTFRPRRRPKRLACKNEKYHHSLKALAIRGRKIHIVGSPELTIEGTPVYLDVEGVPDRDLYYLVGVRVQTSHGVVQHSLWADSAEAEKRVWSEFLGILSAIESPVLIHYGSFETAFLKSMRQRYGGPPDASVAATAIRGALNLLSFIFGRIYFPTHSNGLKDIARFLKFSWSDLASSGTQSIIWRRKWEESRTSTFKQNLITYNSEDCTALELVATTVGKLGQAASKATIVPGEGDVVNVESLKKQKTKWGTFSSSIPGFEEINKAAYWDYQRDRVYVRSSKILKRIALRKRVPRLSLPSASRAIRCSEPEYCPACKQQEFRVVQIIKQTLYDIHFSQYGLRRKVVDYQYYLYCCRICRKRFGAPKEFWPNSKYGRNLVAYVLYQLVEAYLPTRVITRTLNRFHGFGLTQAVIHNLKVSASRFYKETYQTILSNLVKGSLLHVDETRANVKGKAAYVWVLTNLCEVAYVYSDSREGEMVQTLLRDFKGVLVSDFYTAYDALGCPQQKCLIHLMRDLNDAVLDHPFDDDLKQIVRNFAALLKPMVETVDRFGLKRHFLRKHLVNVERFYKWLRKIEARNEVVGKCKERFEKNSDKLFTFLRYDGIPWNNNNAEHAIKAFARLRDVIGGICTAKAVQEYLILLSVRQTCVYQGIDFLDFLRSGERSIDAFANNS